MKTYKGFDKDLKCRDFQFEIGKTYTADGDIKCCENGFHACENPLDIFNYYPPSDSRFCEVEQSGKIDNNDGDSKVCSSEITIKSEINLFTLVQLGVEWIMKQVDVKKIKNRDKDQSAATNTGHYSAATVSGNESIAMAIGYESKAKGAMGCWLVLSEWDGKAEHIIDVQCVRVDGVEILADTFYQLKNGKFVKAE